MHKYSMRAGLLGSATLLAAGISSCAWAQQAAKDPVALNEVIVTAEKRTSNVQKTAESIAVVSGAELTEKAITRVESVVEYIPSVQIQRIAQGTTISIRGVGSNGDSNFVDPAVSTAFDGVYSARAEAGRSAMFDVDRVEVLRGPQGTLYGRNAVGGSLNVITNKPNLNAYGATLNLQAGNFHLYHLDGAVNIPVNDQFALRFSGVRETQDGYFSNGGDANDVYGIRGKVLWTPTSALTIQASADFVRLVGYNSTTAPLAVPGPVINPVNGLPTTQVITAASANPRFAPDTYVVDWFCLSNTAGYTGVYPSSLGSCSGAKNGVTYTRHSTSDPWWVNPDQPADRIDFRFLSSYAQVDYDLGWGLLTFIPSYSTSSRAQVSNLVSGTSILNAGGLAVLNWSLPTRETQYTGELRLTSPASSPIKWVGGLFYLHDDNLPDPSNPVVSSTTGYATYNGDRPTVSRAAFFQVTYPVTDVFRVTGGARYTKDDKTIQYGIITDKTYIPPGATQPLIPLTYDSGLTLGATQSSSAVTYKAGVEYDIRPRSMLYGQISTGYEAGGFFTAAIPAQTFKPEMLTAYEFGSKNRFFDNRLQVNAAVYYYQYNNYQIQYSVPLANLPSNVICSLAPVKAALEARNGVGKACTASNVSTVGGATPMPAGLVAEQKVGNAATGTNKGVELESQWLMTPQDKLGFTLAYVDAKYGNLNTGLPTIDASSGTQTISTPQWVESVSYSHTFDFNNKGSLTVEGRTRISSGYWTGIDHTRYGSWQGGYHRSEATATYAMPNSRWTLGAWVKNIENQAQITDSFPNNKQWVTAPRSYGVNVSARF
jgi:iron complex outermembrane receptor protein